MPFALSQPPLPTPIALSLLRRGRSRCGGVFVAPLTFRFRQSWSPNNPRRKYSLGRLVWSSPRSNVCAPFSLIASLLRPLTTHPEYSASARHYHLCHHFPPFPRLFPRANKREHVLPAHGRSVPALRLPDPCCFLFFFSFSYPTAVFFFFFFCSRLPAIHLLPCLVRSFRRLSPGVVLCLAFGRFYRSTRPLFV